MKGEAIPCAECGTEFVKARRDSRLCSEKCRRSEKKRIGPVRGGKLKHYDPRDCLACSKPLNRDRLMRGLKYCNRTCMAAHRSTPGYAGLDERDCERCGVRFAPDRTGQKYCSRNCKSIKPVVRELTHEETTAPKGAVIRCANCGSGFAKPRRDSRFCAVKCSRSAAFRRGASGGVKLKELDERDCLNCGVALTRLQLLKEYKYCGNDCVIAHRISGEAYDYPARDCGWCGVSFAPRAKNAKYCNENCSSNGWKRDNPKRNREISRTNHRMGKHVRRAAEANAPIFKVRPGFYARKLEEARNRCPGCSRKFDNSAKGKVTWDHRVPVTRGGAFSEGNLWPLCMSCNSSKNARTWMEWRLFKERRNRRKRIVDSR